MNDLLSKIEQGNNRDHKQIIAYEGLLEMKKNGEVPILSDALVTVGNGAGFYVIKTLGNGQGSGDMPGDFSSFRFKIRCLRDRWGNKFFKGDSITREYKKPHERAGRILSSKEIGNLISTGRYRREFVVEKKFDLDDKGCIDCSFGEAVYFLTQNGIHFRDKTRITKLDEFSRNPVKEGMQQEIHKWNWRFEEAPPNEHAKLEPIGERPKDYKARGLKNQ